MNEDAVCAYVDHARATIEMAPQMDEANTKAAVLRDSLDLLSWTIPENTRLEYPVKAFGKTYKADYSENSIVWRVSANLRWNLWVAGSFFSIAP